MGWKGWLVEGPVWAVGRLRAGAPDPARTPPREILVLRSNDFGDLLTTTPIFEALRRRYPAARLVAGIGGWARPVLENNPFVDEVVELDVPWNNKVVADQSWPAVVRFLTRSAQVTRLLGRGGFDVGIDVMGSHVGVLLLIRLGARFRVGVRGYRGGWSACQRHIMFSDRVHVARAALAQAELLGATDLPEARPQLFPTAAERDTARGIWATPGTAAASAAPLRILVGCGGGLADKRWPPEALGAALRLLAEALRAGGGAAEILLVGGPQDRDLAARVMAHGGPGLRSVCGESPLRITFALAEQADLVLTNASMLLHVAAAFHRPTVVVVGGMHVDAAAHDLLWGYPPPYASIGPEPGEAWPAPPAVVAAALRCLALAAPPAAT